MMVPGYLASITVSGVTYSDFASSGTLSLSKDAVDKTKLGQRSRTKLATLKDGSIDVQVHMDTALAVAMYDAYEAIDPIVWVFRAGDATADLGSRTGDGIVVDTSYVGDADSEWNGTISIELTGDYAWTAPA